MKIAIVVNASRKDSTILSTSLLDELAAKYHLSYEIFMAEPENLKTTLLEVAQKSYNTILIAGGDGTVRTAAEILLQQEVAPALAILPLGTFNYFARELNYPQDPEEIFKMIKNNKTKCVDVGEINQNIFINHSSIGFYTYILKLKLKHKQLLGKNKLLKIIFTAINFLNVVPFYKVTISVDNKQIEEKTCLIFIGNNYHLTNLLDFGVRKTLSSGLLAVYILRCKNRWEIIKFLFSILFNTFDKNKYLSEFITTHLVIDSATKAINVVIDGELFKLQTPLNYIVHNKKLLVVCP